MSEEKASKRVARHSVQYWMIRAVVVIVPAFLSYCQAKSEAQSEAEDIAKHQAGQVEDKAGAGYDEMVRAVKQLDAEIREHRKDLYSMKGHIEALENRLSMRIRTRPTGSDENPPASGSGAAPPHPMPPPQKALNLAPNLDQAAAKHGVSKK